MKRSTIWRSTTRNLSPSGTAGRCRSRSPGLIIARFAFAGLAVLTMSACVTTARPDHGSSLQRGSPSGYSSTESRPGGPSYPVSNTSGAADLGSGDAIPAGYSEDRAQSTALTSYLKRNRLPLVGAQVFTNSSGNHQVILHGFVATDIGKQNATARSRHYLNEPDLPVVNRIVVRPELLASGGGTATPSPSPSASSPGDSANRGRLGNVESYRSQAEQQQSQSEIQTIIMLLQLMSLFL